MAVSTTISKVENGTEVEITTVAKGIDETIAFALKFMAIRPLTQINRPGLSIVIGENGETYTFSQKGRQAGPRKSKMAETPANELMASIHDDVPRNKIAVVLTKDGAIAKPVEAFRDRMKAINGKYYEVTVTSGPGWTFPKYREPEVRALLQEHGIMVEA